MSDNQTFLRDKMYDFVPLLDKCERNPALGHNILNANTYSGKMFLKITVLSPLHIGSGQQYCENEKVIKRHMTRNGQAVIPGSSVKGAVRSIAEAVSFSCGVKLPYTDSKAAVLKRALPERNQSPCNNSACLCPTCSVFGMVYARNCYKGKVSFGEFTCETGSLKLMELPSLESPFKDYNGEHCGNERLYYCKACEDGDCQNCTKQNYFERIAKDGQDRSMRFRGRKFYYTDKFSECTTEKQTYIEMMEEESTFRGEVTFENLTENEFKLLAYALDIKHYFTMKIGYGKPLGYGKVYMELEKVEDLRSRYGIRLNERRNGERSNELNLDRILGFAESYQMDNSSEIIKAIKCLKRIMG